MSEEDRKARVGEMHCTLPSVVGNIWADGKYGAYPDEGPEIRYACRHMDRDHPIGTMCRCKEQCSFQEHITDWHADNFPDEYEH